MKASKFTDAQKAFIIKQGEDGMTGPVTLSCRPKCSFKPPFARRRPGFSNPMLSAFDADCRSH